MSEAAGSTPRVLGRSVTHGSTVPLGVGDPIEASREVRRALADAGHKAVEVSVIAVATVSPITPADLRSFARRALGPHGDGVRSYGLVGSGDAAELVAQAVGAIERAEHHGEPVAIAVGIAADGTTEAWCVELGGDGGLSDASARR